VLALVLLTTPARAEPTAEQLAERLFDEALTLVAAGKYESACPKLEQSQKLDPALGTQFDLGDCYEHTGRTASARRLFTEVATAAKAAGKSEREKAAHVRAEALDARVARLAVRAPAVAHLAITLDGVPLAEAAWSQEEPIDAGAHTIAATAPGKKRFETTFQVSDGLTATIAIPAFESGATTSNGQRSTARIAAGVGLLGVAVGATAGVISIVKHGQAKHACPTFDPCDDPRGRSDWTTATSAGTVSTVAFVVGGAGLATAAVLWFTAPREEQAPPSAKWRLAPTFGPGGGGLAASGAW
jgi:hypothetical protein